MRSSAPRDADDARSVGESAAQHAGERQFAAMTGMDSAQDLSERRAFGRKAEPLARLRDARRLVPQRFQKPRDAVAAIGRAHQQRHDMADAQLLGEIVENAVARRLDFADQLLHQRVVVIGEALQHGIARLLVIGRDAFRRFDDGGWGVLAIEESPFEGEVDEADRHIMLPDRELAQQQRRARGRLQHRQSFADAAAGEVDLVEKQNARQPQFLELAHDDLQRRRLAAVGFADHDRRIANGQSVAHVVDEFDRAGAVEEGETVAHIIDAGDIGLDAHRMGARLGAGIADAGALAHRALARRAAAARQNGFEKAGFAALKGADERDQPRPRNSSIARFRGADHDDPPNFLAVGPAVRRRPGPAWIAQGCKSGGPMQGAN